MGGAMGVTNQEVSQELAPGINNSLHTNESLSYCIVIDFITDPKKIPLVASYDMREGKL